MRSNLGVALFGCALALGCGSPPASAPPAQLEPRTPVSSGAEQPRGREDASLIPRQVLFGNPDRISVQISPDGKMLSFLAPSAGVLNVWVAPANDPAAARALTQDKGRGIRTYQWAFDNRHILYLQDDKGDENFHLHSVEVISGNDRDLTPMPGVRAQLAASALSRKHPGEVVVGLNDRKKELHDLYRIDVRTGARQLLIQNDEFASFVVDDDFRVKLAQRLTPEGGAEVLELIGKPKAGAAPATRPFMSIAQPDMLTTSAIGYSADHQLLYLVDSRDRDTSGMFSIDRAGKATLLASDPHADVASALIDPSTLRVQAVGFEYDRQRWQVIDPAVRPDLEYLSTVVEGDVRVVSRSLDDKTWIVNYLVDRGPARFYRYDRAQKRATFLFTSHSKLEGLTLAAMHPVSIRSRDNLELVSYLSLPPGSDKDGDGVPDAPVPLVLVVHGGPWARDTWGYQSQHQWLANRDYAALSVNYRGSTGFGKRFINAGDRQWGAKMHDDLIDAVEWAVARRIAPRDKIAIMGGSYGGYATLVGMTFTPRVFACGVDIVGPSNLQTLLTTIPPYWKPIFNLFTSRVGDPRTEEGQRLLHSRSPLHFAERIERPLLIGQGVNDPRVKRAESDQIVDAMKRKGIPVTYVLYADEGHGFQRPENRLSFFGVTEAFLSPCLGGSYQPIGDDFQRSSIDIAQGAELIPGLPRPSPQVTATR